MKKTILALSCLFFSGMLLAQTAANKEGYAISVKIKNSAAKELYLGFHYDNNKYVRDTAKALKPGEFLFKGDKALEPGLYIIVLPSMNMFDFIVDENQHFSIETDTLNLVRSAKVKGHDLNAAFFKFMDTAGQKQLEMMKARKRIEALGKDNDSSKIYQARIESWQKEIEAEEETIGRQFPNSLVAHLFRASKEVQHNMELKTQEDSTRAYYYTVNHFWDNYDWSDGGLARTPILSDKLTTYFDKLVLKVPDTLNAYTDKVIAMSRANKENFKYTVQFLYKYFANSKLMCVENSFVHVAKNYYNKENAWWADSTTLSKIAKRVSDMEPTLCGKTAPDLSLPDTSGTNFFRLSKFDAEYTLLVFWDPGCGHCQKEIPRLQQLYDSTLASQGMKIYGVCTKRNIEDLKEFVKSKKIRFLNTLVTEDMAKNAAKYIYEYKVTELQSMNLHLTYDISSTPLILVLDKNKKIIARKLGAEDVVGFMKRYKLQQAQKKS